VTIDDVCWFLIGLLEAASLTLSLPKMLGWETPPAEILLWLKRGLIISSRKLGRVEDGSSILGVGLQKTNRFC
jgi:hypothetical protein